MIPDSLHYLCINALTIAYPLAQSFEKRLRFLSNWRALLTGTAVAGGIFLAWDELFTALGVWGFNERYITGIYIGRLPLEEYNFFFTVPFACLFIYEVLRHFIKQDPLSEVHQAITFFFFLTTLFLGAYFFPRLYTSVSFFLGALLMGLQFFVFRFAWMGRFFLGYFVSLVPFLIMNAWLTGAFTEEPIVWYNNLENTGIRVSTIPIEDFIYLLSFLFLVTLFYERSRISDHATHDSVNFSEA
jgi:lycopene cyclase domain-containing protein